MMSEAIAPFPTASPPRMVGMLSAVIDELQKQQAFLGILPKPSGLEGFDRSGVSVEREQEHYILAFNRLLFPVGPHKGLHRGAD